MKKRKFKFTFGHLWIAIGLFMANTVVLVATSASKEVVMETERYYEEELHYQEVIDKRKNYAQLNEKVQVGLNGSGDVLVKFPDGMNVRSGHAHFLNPVSAERDLTLSVTGDLQVPSEKLKSGTYTLKLDWTAGGTDYYMEKEFFIP